MLWKKNQTISLEYCRRCNQLINSPPPLVCTIVIFSSEFRQGHRSDHTPIYLMPLENEEYFSSTFHLVFFCSIGKAAGLEWCGENEASKVSSLLRSLNVGCLDCVKVFLLCHFMLFPRSNQLQPQSQSQMQREKNKQVLPSSFSSLWYILKQQGAWNHPSCVFGTSHTFITRLSQPLVTFLSRSFQSWSRLISMTAFGTSWTTLFLPSTSCINSSSTPV